MKTSVLLATMCAVLVAGMDSGASNQQAIANVGYKRHLRAEQSSSNDYEVVRDEETVGETPEEKIDAIDSLPAGGEVKPANGDGVVKEDPKADPAVVADEEPKKDNADPPVVKEEPKADPPVENEEPKADPPVENEEPKKDNADPPVVKEEPKADPPVENEEPKADPPVVKEEPKADPPVENEEPKADPPADAPKDKPDNEAGSH